MSNTNFTHGGVVEWAYFARKSEDGDTLSIWVLHFFGVLLQSWELCLVLGLASILSLAIFFGFATCQYIEASETFKFCNFLGLVFCQSGELCTSLKLEEQEEEQEEEEVDDVLVVE